MTLESLLQAVRSHEGTFLCELIHEPERSREIPFRHLITAPEPGIDAPAVGRLADAYGTFGSITFYHHDASGDAARYLAPVSEWPTLAEGLAGWVEMLDEDELDELLPFGIDGCVVIGETPASGNYILVPLTGPSAGHVIEFDHDGFEVTDVASDVVAYIGNMLTPDSARLTDFASHMRFADGAAGEQWWIRECRDNSGHVVATSC